MEAHDEYLHRRGAENAEFPQRELTEKVIASAIEVHKCLGSGLLESVYQEALPIELRIHGLRAASQVSVPLLYKGQTLASSLRLDLLVEDAIVVEIKAVQGLEPIHRAQLLTYLRLSGMTTGLLINFNEETLTRGVKRVVNSLRTSALSAPLR